MLKSSGLFVAVLLFLAGGVWLLWNRPSSPLAAALEDRAQATRMLAQYLEHHFTGEVALIVSNPFTQEAGRSPKIYGFEEQGLRGLREGLGERVKLGPIVFPEIRPEARAHPGAVFVDPSTQTPMSFLVTDHSFDELAAGHPECRIIISLIGLPTRTPQLQIWKPDDPRVFALLLPDLRMVGTPQEVMQAFQSGKIVAAVVRNPEATSPESRAGYQLVTLENVEAVFRSHPEVLGFRSRHQ